MPSQHAVLSASAAHRWLNCPPSVRAAEQLPQATTVAALEGTAAHALAEYKLRQHFQPHKRLTRPVSEWDGPEMEEHTDAYCQYVTSQVDALEFVEDESVKVRIEQRVDYSAVAEGGFGTADFIAHTSQALHIIDLKYGQGVRVDAPENPQLRLYAYGAGLAEGLGKTAKIQMSVFQPRLGHVSTDLMTMRSLREWAEGEVEPKARLAWEGKGEYCAGDWCRFCPLKATCRARRDLNLQIAKHEFQPPPALDETEIAEILTQAPQVKTWLKDVEDYALEQATRGTTIPGFKPVAGRGRRKIIDEKQLAKNLQAAGVNPWEKKLLTITQLEKKTGKKLFSELSAGLVEKAPGKPQLAPADDPRPQLAAQTPDQDFTPINE